MTFGALLRAGVVRWCFLCGVRGSQPERVACARCEAR